MRWTLLLIAGFTMLSARAMAQQPDSAQIAIRYKFLYIPDTTNRDKPFTENMVLIVGKRSGLYKTNEPPPQQLMAQYNDNNGPSHGPDRGPVINNPIELPEKK
jgi:hypothetical protein